MGEFLEFHSLWQPGIATKTAALTPGIAS